MEKHTIKADGAPFMEVDGEVHARNGDKSTAGEGSAWCSCGALSPELPTRAARKAWHKTHKENTVSENPVEKETPEVVEQPQEKEVTVDSFPAITVAGYPEKKLLPAYFFGSIIKLGVQPSLEEHSEVSVQNTDGSALTVTLSGEQDALEDAQEVLAAIYELLPGYLKDFKAGFKPKAEGKEGHKESWIARRDFCVDFAKGFTDEFYHAAAKRGTSAAYKLGVGAAETAFEDGDELI